MIVWCVVAHKANRVKRNPYGTTETMTSAAALIKSSFDFMRAHRPHPASKTTLRHFNYTDVPVVLVVVTPRFSSAHVYGCCIVAIVT